MTIAGCVWNHEGLSGVGWLAVALVISSMRNNKEKQHPAALWLPYFR